MIAERRIFDNDGVLVWNDALPYGIFVYHDKGEATGRYKAWDKVRVVEVVFVKKQNRWFFLRKKISKSDKTKGTYDSRAGIPIELFSEFIEAIEILARKMGVMTWAGQGEKSVDIEEDEAEKLMRFIKEKRK